MNKLYIMPNECSIPSCEWKGFYVYSANGTKHKMNCFIAFENGSVKGQGNDDIDNYSWNGRYDEDLNVNMIKSYPTHSVLYIGHADENGIWGKWKMSGSSGGFHLWPISQESDIFYETEVNEIQEELVLHLHPIK